MLDDYNEILKPAEVCEILLIGKNTLYQLLNTKQLALAEYIRKKSFGEA